MGHSTHRGTHLQLHLATCGRRPYQGGGMLEKHLEIAACSYRDTSVASAAVASVRDVDYFASPVVVASVAAASAPVASAVLR